MHEDLDDTVLGTPHPRIVAIPDIDEDTLVPARPEKSEKPEKSARPEESAKVEESGKPEESPEPEEPAQALGPAHPAAAERTEESLPELVDPVTPTRQRRVPLTDQRLRESLKTAPATPPPASVASSLLAIPQPPLPRPAIPRPAAAQPAIPQSAVPQPIGGVVQSSAYSFRIGDRAPVPLDIPALVGRRPMAPRIPGKELPRLVRVSSPLSEVSGTHLEVRQDGASVVVTDLRSTNGTVVRMPGARPLKLRQGESVVVRPGTLVDIGDGNILEILPPPRLAVPGDPAGGGQWR